MRILLIEDEAPIAAALARGLKAEGFSVDIASSGEDGLWRAREGEYAAIVLDLMLPGINGSDVCSTLRREGKSTPILVLTARAGESDETDNLDLGADDFLRKPFSLKVLVARLHALLRRGRDTVPERYAVGALRFDARSRQCETGGVRVELTGRESALLLALLRAGGDVVTRRALLDDVWGMDFEGDPNIIDVYMTYLRRKLGAGHAKRLLHTVRGVGYRLCEK